MGVYSTVVVHPRDEEDENFSDPEAYRRVLDENTPAVNRCCFGIKTAVG